MFIEELTKLTMEVLIVMAILGGIFYVFVKGLEGMEQTECQKWEQQKEKYPGWFATDWQEAQCQRYEIEL